MRTLFFFCLLLCVNASLWAEPDSLESFGFSSDGDGARQCLRELAWTEDTERRFTQLLDDLGDDRFGVREAAMAALMEWPALPRARVRLIARDRDEDFRQRIVQIVSVNTAEGIERLFQAALEQILKEDPDDWVSLILSACPSVPDPERRVWELALRVADREETIDIERTHLSLESPYPLERVVAATALHRQCGMDAWERLNPLLTDDDDRVRLQIALLAVEDQQPECLPTFLELLRSEELTARFKSLSALRQLTGMDFGYKASALPEHREAGVVQWIKWYETEGDRVQLKFPGA